MMRHLRSMFILLFVCVGFAAYAQEEDQVTEDIITYDRMVYDTITERSIYDAWYFNAQRGDVILVTMQASDGLAPLIGIATEGRTILARSDQDPEDNPQPPAEPNETVTLEFEIPEEGQYIILATRVGNQDGTTTGSYSLLLQRTNAAGSRTNDLQAVTFRCGEYIVTTAATLRFNARPDVDTYRISVYGLDGFQPLIRVIAGEENELTDCSSDYQQMHDDRITLYGEETLDLSPIEGDLPAAQMGLRGGSSLDRIDVTIGSVNGTSGRYIAVIDGFTLNIPGDEVRLETLLGPLATSTELLVYMVQVGSNRIDPLMRFYTVPNEEPLTCDDAGRRGCEDVPPLIGTTIDFGENDLLISGTRFSAGLRLVPGNIESLQLGFTSRVRNATGEFAVLLIGELPARQNPEDSE